MVGIVGIFVSLHIRIKLSPSINLFKIFDTIGFVYSVGFRTALVFLFPFFPLRLDIANIASPVKLLTSVFCITI